MDIMDDTILIFDLDDTLYKEIDFLKSAFREIASKIGSRIVVDNELILSEMIDNYYKGLNVFEIIFDKYPINDFCKKDLILIYRNHIPQIGLKPNYRKLLTELKQKVFKTGLITDGRSIQQRNKLLALGLSEFFDDIIISEEFGSEKPNIENFKYFVNKYGENVNYIYVGDNVKKDFIIPNQLGWNSICLLDNGTNIHKQDFKMEIDFLPKFFIRELTEIQNIFKKLNNV